MDRLGLYFQASAAAAQAIVLPLLNENSEQELDSIIYLLNCLEEQCGHA